MMKKYFWACSVDGNLEVEAWVRPRGLITVVLAVTIITGWIALNLLVGNGPPEESKTTLGKYLATYPILHLPWILFTGFLLGWSLLKFTGTRTLIRMKSGSIVGELQFTGTILSYHNGKIIPTFLSNRNIFIYVTDDIFDQKISFCVCEGSSGEKKFIENRYKWKNLSLVHSEYPPPIELMQETLTEDDWVELDAPRHLR
jgi:hypothetical protein